MFRTLTGGAASLSGCKFNDQSVSSYAPSGVKTLEIEFRKQKPPLVGDDMVYSAGKSCSCGERKSTGLSLTNLTEY